MRYREAAMRSTFSWASCVREDFKGSEEAAIKRIQREKWGIDKRVYAIQLNVE